MFFRRSKYMNRAEILGSFEQGEQLTYAELIKRLPNEFRFREILLNIPKFMNCNKPLKVTKLDDLLYITPVPYEQEDTSLVIWLELYGIRNMEFDYPEAEEEVNFYEGHNFNICRNFG